MTSSTQDSDREGEAALLIPEASHFTLIRGNLQLTSITLPEMFNNNQQGHNTVHSLNWNIKKCNNTIINNSILTSNIKDKLFQIIKGNSDWLLTKMQH